MRVCAIYRDRALSRKTDDRSPSLFLSPIIGLNNKLGYETDDDPAGIIV